MQTNRQILEWLFERNQIAVQRSALFDTPPPPMPPGLSNDRINGMLFGLAVGDALGNTTESLLPADRRQYYGIISDYLPHHRFGDARGYPSDDSQLAFWTLEQLLEDNGYVPDHVARRFCSQPIEGIGSTVSAFIRNYRDKHLPWYESGIRSASNGALMRIATMVVPHLATATSALWVDTALNAMTTHNDASSVAACLAFVSMLWHLLAMEQPPPPLWWLDTYVHVARPLEGDASLQPRGGDFCSYNGPIWRFVDTHVRAAYEQGVPLHSACNSWHSGAFLLETIPCVLSILMHHGDDPTEAVIRAVNDTKDNDTIGAIVGAAIGALHGASQLPAHWLRNLSGRTTSDDEGKIFALANHAWERWWLAPRATLC